MNTIITNFRYTRVVLPNGIILAVEPSDPGWRTAIVTNNGVSITMTYYSSEEEATKALMELVDEIEKQNMEIVRI